MTMPNYEGTAIDELAAGTLGDKTLYGRFVEDVVTLTVEYAM